MVDKLARRIFTLPFNLRDIADRSGYPEADTDVAEFFASDDLSLHEESKLRFLHFFGSLFGLIKSHVEAQAASTREEFASTWYEKVKSPSQRSVFYNKAVEDAHKQFQQYVRTTYQESTSTINYLKANDAIVKERMGLVIREIDRVKQEVVSKAEEILQLIAKRTDLSWTDRRQVCLLMYFDEAHCLHKPPLLYASGSNLVRQERTAYYALIEALDELRGLNIFSLFLSTTSSLARFAPPKQNFMSDRSRLLDIDLQPPFTELPFDIHDKTTPLATEGEDTLNQICTTSYMARFGRPLFASMHGANNDVVALAMHKLMFGQTGDPKEAERGRLAVISTRVLMDFEPRRADAHDLETEMVAKNMRVAFSIPKHRYYMRTGTPSEPVLAEAAARLMHDKFGEDRGRSEGLTSRRVSLNNLNTWAQDGLLEKGELGELVARALVTFAHDAAIQELWKGKVPNLTNKSDPVFSKPIPVITFIRHLVSPAYADKLLKSKPVNMKGKSLEEAFKDGYVHFTHFARLDNASLVTDEVAMAGMFRGVAWIFYRGQKKIDFGIPVFFGKLDDPLVRSRMSMLFFQVKNKISTEHVTVDLESDLDHKFFTDSEPRSAGRPYMVIVMNLGTVGPIVEEADQRSNEKGSSLPQSLTSSSPKLPATGVFGSPSKATGAGRSTNFDYVHPDRPSRAGPSHPRYTLNIEGCSDSVYRVIDKGEKSLYTQILKSREILAEHPRPDSNFLKAVLEQKPWFQNGSSSFGWIKSATESGLQRGVVQAPQIPMEEPEGMVIS